MSVTIRELMRLDIMKDFSVAAGAAALDRIVRGTGILDFELSRELEGYRARAGTQSEESAAGTEERFSGCKAVFDKDSMVLSSLLFTKGDPALLYEAVEKLIELEVSCLAYKPVIFEVLPQEVIRLAEQNDFCILRFGGGEWFEDVIHAVVSEIKSDDRNRKLEGQIKRLLSRDLTPDQIQGALEFINPAYTDYILAVNIIRKAKRDSASSAKPAAALAERHLSKRLSGKCSLCRYEDSLFLLIFGETGWQQRYMAVLQDALYELGIQLQDYIAGFGTMHPAAELDRTLIEAHYARMAAEIERCGEMEYRRIGIYQMIFASRDREGLHRYMDDYLAPIYGRTDSNSEELFRTAISYVLAKGDLSLTAQTLCCHKNTARYRVAKLQEKLGGSQNARDFFTELSLAVKIYLAESYRSEKELQGG